MILPEEKRERAAKILDILAEEVGLKPSEEAALIELKFSNPLELLIATILSAQCTDARVNITTGTLFKKYMTAADYADVDPEEFEDDIKNINFFRNKAKNIKSCAAKLVRDFNGKVPGEMDALTSLAGVGRKTANVVLGNAFGVPALAVDTHVKRVAARLGLTALKDPDKIESELTSIIDKERWTAATHLLILHGRRCCKARKPLCGECPLCSLCDFSTG